MNLTITPAYDVPQEIGELFAEYTGMLLENAPDFRQYLELQNYDDELLHLEAKYGLLDGRLYLARWDGAAAGCIGLRRLDSMRCEMKRLYVRPAFRGIENRQGPGRKADCGRTGNRLQPYVAGHLPFSPLRCQDVS